MRLFAVVVDDTVAGDAVEPSLDGQAPIGVVGEPLNDAHKDVVAQIFAQCHIAGAAINEAPNGVGMVLVQISDTLVVHTHILLQLLGMRTPVVRASTHSLHAGRYQCITTQKRRVVCYNDTRYIEKDL